MEFISHVYTLNVIFISVLGAIQSGTEISFEVDINMDFDDSGILLHDTEEMDCSDVITSHDGKSSCDET